MNLSSLTWLDAVLLLIALVGLIVAVPVFRRRRRRNENTR
jgi:hypothetical protein